MKNTFKEYHQYTETELKTLWEKCIFVFDTNSLLNMYRYSRETVEVYFKVLDKLKKDKQLWIPYQVGYEFFENRINVISENEESYDKILKVFNNAKSEIGKNFKDHPFLDISKVNKEMNQCITNVEKMIKNAQKKHPKWLKKDEVLEQINQLFIGAIGKSYDKGKLDEIKKDGRERYDQKIPPGFEDDKKDESKKFGDLILWHQIIDKAKEDKKPIIFISGDVKEDWWLIKNGKKIMPHPQLKKEMYDKANVEFHIYTADMFLTISKESQEGINDKTIDEVKKVSEYEEARKSLSSNFLREKTAIERELIFKNQKHLLFELSKYLDTVEPLLLKIGNVGINLEQKEHFNYLLNNMNRYKKRVSSSLGMRSKTLSFFKNYTQEILSFLAKIVSSQKNYSSLSFDIHEAMEQGNYLISSLKHFSNESNEMLFDF